MSLNRNQIIVGVVAAVALIAAYWMLVLSPKRDEAAKLAAQVDQVEQDVQAAQAQLATFREAKDSYKTNYATVARLGKAVPEDDDVRSLVVQLDSAANRTNVDFRSINVGGGSAPAAAGGAAGAGETPPPGAVVGEAGFVTMPFSFDFTGKFFRLSDYVSHLERFVALRNSKIDVTGRLLLVDSLSLQPSADGFPNVDAEIGATSYLLPKSQGATGGATPAGPAVTDQAASAALTTTGAE